VPCPCLAHIHIPEISKGTGKRKEQIEHRLDYGQTKGDCSDDFDHHIILYGLLATESMLEGQGLLYARDFLKVIWKNA
jgi:hypothetical protein